MLIDITKCIGCAVAFRLANWRTMFRTATTNLGRALPHSRLGDGISKVDSPKAERMDFRGEGSWGQEFLCPKLCNHCADSPCTQVCPVGATFISPDGVVLIDQKYCLGCRYCVQACPTVAGLSTRRPRRPTSARSAITDHQG